MYNNLPGSVHAPDVGAYCEEHMDIEAVAKIQGEADSMGAEYRHVCQLCLDEWRSMDRVVRPGRCDLCGQDVDHLKKYRDPEEGLSGPVYDACESCIRRHNQHFIGDDEPDPVDPFDPYED